MPLWNTQLGAILGYVFSFGFMGLVILIGETLQRKLNLEKEIVRKCEHLASGVSWLFCYFVTGPTIHLFIINIIAVVAFGVITFGGLMKSIERDDTEKSYGVFYFGVATAIAAGVVVFVPGGEVLYPLNGIAWYCLAFGDGFAPLIARLFKKNRELLPTKTWAGSITVLVISTAVAAIFNAVFSLGFTWHFILSVGCLSCLLEAFGRKGLDNFYIEFGVFGYLILHHYGFVTGAVEVAIIVALLIVFASSKSRALTPAANVVSFLFLLLCAFCGGWSLMMMVVVLYICAAIVSKITTKQYNKRSQTHKEKSARTAGQILANSTVASVFGVLFFLLHHPVLLYCSMAAIGEEFADSMASDFGRLSRKQPLDILHRRTMSAGISGGISVFGTLMALLGSVVAVAIPYAVSKVFPLQNGDTMSLMTALVLCVLAFLGTLVDSMLGSGLQVLYRCGVCQSYVENPVHCKEGATYVKGLRWMSNSLVNFFSSLITAGVACALLFLIKG